MYDSLKYQNISIKNYNYIFVFQTTAMWTNHYTQKLVYFVCSYWRSMDTVLHAGSIRRGSSSK
jgi:hypothetical protein